MIWIQQPMTPQDRWRVHIDAAFHVDSGTYVTGVSVYDEAGALVGSLSHVSKSGVKVTDLSSWVSAHLLDVHDAMTPTFPST